MGAETLIYVQIIVGKAEWIPVSAVTLADAEEAAAKLPGVIAVTDSTYEKPEQ